MSAQCRAQARTSQTTRLFSSDPGDGVPPARAGVFQSVSSAPRSVVLSGKICRGAQLHSNELTPNRLSSYVFCVLDCEGDVLGGIPGLHLTWCGLSEFFSVFIIEMD